MADTLATTATPTGATTLTTGVPETSAPPAATPATGAPATPDAKATPPTEKPAGTPDAKPDTAPDAKPGAPLELKLPEGLTANEAFEKFKGLAQNLGLKGEQAQKVLDFYAENQKAADAAGRLQLEQMQAGWLQSLKADTEVGGANFDASAQVARKAVLKFGTPALRQLFDETGIGNHPELVRVFVKIGKALGEDSVAGVNGAPAGSGQPKTAKQMLDEMYPSMRSKES